MPTELSIRRERPDQPEVVRALAALDEYLATLYPPEANYLLDIQALMAPEVVFLVARQAGALVGTAAFRRQEAEPGTDDQPYGEVKRMFVNPVLRGQRIGARLLQALEAQMREQGLALALLETGHTQTEAVRLYEAAGYARRGPFGGYPDNGLSLFLGKRL